MERAIQAVGVRSLYAPHDFVTCYDEWRANCGPGALAAVLGRSVSDVRRAFPQFPEKPYTTLSAMRAALRSTGEPLGESTLARKDGVFPLVRYGLCQVQWTGPWTEPGANPRWAYTHTHWVGLAVDGEGDARRGWVYDINNDVGMHLQDQSGAVFGDEGGGWVPASDWVADVVPGITGEIKRADGGWYVRAVLTVLRDER